MTTLVTVRPNNSSSGHGGAEIFGGSASYHASVSDENTGTGIRLPGTAPSTWQGVGGHDYVKLDFATPTIPAGMMIAAVAPRYFAMLEQSPYNPTYGGMYDELTNAAGPSTLAYGYTGVFNDSFAVAVGGNGATNNPAGGKPLVPNAHAGNLEVYIASHDVSVFVYEVYLDFYLATIDVPAGLIPANGSTVTTGTPLLFATVGVE